MKIDSRGLLVASSSALVLAKSQLSPAVYAQPSPHREALSIEGKKVAVYTTADNSKHRLSATETLAFKHKAKTQALEGGRYAAFWDIGETEFTFLFEYIEGTGYRVESFTTGARR